MMRMFEYRVVKATTADVETCQEIARRTFYETFADGNTEENMTKYLKENFSTDKIQNEICNSDSLIFFAYSQENVVGYLKLNFGGAQTELQDSSSVEIERIYVLKEFHGKGVGQVLYDKALEVATAKQVDYLWLGVWEENPRAINFYKKNGFVEFDKHIFTLGDDEQIDIMMKLVL